MPVKYIFFILFAGLCLMQTKVFADVNKYWIDQEVQSFIQHKPVKAIVYGLWINGKPVSINALGESMTKVPATTDMHFRIGGVTETMLTTLLMQMVEQHKISLDDKISRWYPDLPNANKITIKMLANGTSGLRDYVFNKNFIDAVIKEPFRQWTDESILAYATPAAFAPDTSQRYSHTDYVVLGSILTKVGKQPLNTLFTSYIFRKLNLQQTTFDNVTASMAAPILHAFSQDRSVYEDATFWNPSWTSYSGSSVSTIEDLGTWANAWMKGTLLAKKSAQQLKAPDTAGKGANTRDLYFAMGFAAANHWLFQNPAFNGYSGVFAVLPEKNIVFIAFYTMQETDKPPVKHLGVSLWQEVALKLTPAAPCTV